MIPNRVTHNWLRDNAKRLGDRMGKQLTLRQNNYMRYAVFAEGVGMISPGYRSNQELACWLAGAWLQYDKPTLFTEDK